MPSIHLTTFIAAPVERVFDLSRSIDLHKKTMAHTNEQAVSGTTVGFKTRVLRVRVIEMIKPFSFTDEMVDGDLKSMKHEHHFKKIENGTLMIDFFSFTIPYGSFGNMINKLFLTNYMKKLLEQRNTAIKEYAESEKWKFILNN
jgi:ligand-binding SRPBCC domain-containing protein